MMPDALLEACVAAPDDDAPRLVWADAVGGERGELVVIQCDLARGDLPPAEVVRRKQRERELLANHAAAWSGLRGLALACTYRRGFVEAVEVEVEIAIANHAAIARAAPLAALCVRGLSEDEADNRPEHAPELMARLLAHATPWRGLDLGSAGITSERDSEFNPYHWQSLTDETITAIAPSLGRPRAFGCSGLGEDGARALLAAGALAGVERLALRDPRLDWPTVAELIASAPRLVALELGIGLGPKQRSPVVRALSASIVELTLAGGDDDAEALAESAVAPRLERLSLHHGSFRRTRALAAFPQLRSLNLGDITFGDSGYAQSKRDALVALAMTALPSLRELRITDSGIKPESIAAVVDALGAQLELLDIRGLWRFDERAAELAARVAGELRTGPWDQPEVLLHPGTSRAPWWDQPRIAL